VEGLDGVSLRPLLEDPTAIVKDAAFTMVNVGATRRGLVARSTRTDRYRYTRWPDGREELYDHQSDPDEMIDLAAHPAHAEAVRELRDLARVLPEIQRERLRPRE
jgi:hypothetical protein